MVRSSSADSNLQAAATTRQHSREQDGIPGAWCVLQPPAAAKVPPTTQPSLFTSIANPSKIGAAARPIWTHLTASPTISTFVYPSSASPLEHFLHCTTAYHAARRRPRPSIFRIQPVFTAVNPSSASPLEHIHRPTSPRQLRDTWPAHQPSSHLLHSCGLPRLQNDRCSHAYNPERATARHHVRSQRETIKPRHDLQRTGPRRSVRPTSLASACEV